MRLKFRRLVLLLAPLLLVGCANLHHAVPIDWEHGAKRGVVIDVLQPSTREPSTPACLMALSQEQLRSGRYVRVQYIHVRRYITDFGMLAPGVVAHSGDPIEYFPANCEQGKLGVVRRVLPKAPDE